MLAGNVLQLRPYRTVLYRTGWLLYVAHAGVRRWLMSLCCLDRGIVLAECIMLFRQGYCAGW
jgi:hypothetical protein